MKFPMRGVAALLLSTTLVPLAIAGPVPQDASAQAPAALSSERAKASYMVGMDVGASVRSAGSEFDLAAFERSLRNTVGGGEPLVDEATARATMMALAARGQARNGGLPPGAPLPDVDWTTAALVVGVSVGGSLAPIAEHIDLDIVMQAVRTVAGGGTPLLSEAEYTQVRDAFSRRMQQEMEAKARELGARNIAEGQAFLAANKSKKGVFTTGSGLQYMVLRPGAGPRPKPTDTVRVHYRGTLLDGTEFDSSYSRQAPAEFPLDQVVTGWSEGVSLMPVGAKYRFWIPAELGYGQNGTPGGPIGPNATLVFDVELLEIL